MGAVCVFMSELENKNNLNKRGDMSLQSGINWTTRSSVRGLSVLLDGHVFADRCHRLFKFPQATWPQVYRTSLFSCLSPLSPVHEPAVSRSPPHEAAVHQQEPSGSWMFPSDVSGPAPNHQGLLTVHVSPLNLSVTLSRSVLIDVMQQRQVWMIPQTSSPRENQIANRIQHKPTIN